METFYKIDNETGRYTDVTAAEEKPEFDNWVSGWGDRIFYDPIYDFEKEDWVEGKAKEEIKSEKTEFERQENRKKLHDLAQKKLLEKITTDYLLGNELQEEEKALFVALYEVWQPDEVYYAGDKISREDTVFEVIQQHTSQIDWQPENTPALYKKIYQTETSDGEEVIPDFVQPTGAHDAYKKGDKVLFNGKVYISTLDNNIWDPISYSQGWTET